ncbi:MAG: nucleotidyltransferase family protein [Verrucomicrobiota bacterium]|nr:nucleotidyltransferase family protein [Limisphaera sp.]MDW8380766.1 nucleotidyltransferase family protein [Verrucomicrobiota bacterium]
MSPMKAVILAAGRGTRMRELTRALPKPMLRVQGRPILEHIIDGLGRAGIREIFIVTGFRAEVIEQYFADGKRWGVQIEFGRQTVQNGTGKAAEPARAFVGSSPFLLTYGDILVRPETYHDVLGRYQHKPCEGVIAVTQGEDVRQGGLVLFDSHFRLRRIVEKPSLEELDALRQDGLLGSCQPVWYNAGIYLFAPVVFDFMAQLKPSPRGEYELTDAINAMACTGHRILGCPIQGRWVDVRDPEVLRRLEEESATSQS